MINIYLNPKVIGLNANHSNRKKARNYEEKLFEKDAHMDFHIIFVDKFFI